MNGVYSLALPWCPPSINDVAVGRPATRGAAFKQSKTKKRLVSDLTWALLEAKVPKGLTAVYVEAELRFPRLHRRDEGNYRAWLEKALGDALDPNDKQAAHRWISDDTPAHFTFGPVTFSPDRGPEQTVIALYVTKADEEAA